MAIEWSKQYQEHNGLGQQGTAPQLGHEHTTDRKGPGCGCDECVAERKTAGTI
jgi:hypothetical protein